jgi:ABC-2 type transport system permease protein
MKLVLLKALAFLRRDWQTETSYKLDFFLRAFRMVGALILFFFIGKLVQPDATGDLSKYGGNYFAFAVIGLGLAGFFQQMLTLFATSIRTAQMTGCLEAMLSTQTDPTPIVLMSSIFGILWSGVQLLVLFLVSTLAFRIDLGQANYLGSIVIFILATFTFVSFGVLSAAIIVWLKKGDPIGWIISTLGAMIGGAYFPLDVMPVWLQKVAQVIPITHALDAMRMTLLKGATLGDVAEPTIILGVMAAVLFPISIWLFSVSVTTAKREGTLMQY